MCLVLFPHAGNIHPEALCFHVVRLNICLPVHPSACPYHSCKCNITRTPEGNFLIFFANFHLEDKLLRFWWSEVISCESDITETLMY